MAEEPKTGIEGDLYVYNGTTSLSGTIAITGSRVGYCEGVKWSWDRNMIQVWDRGTFQNWKSGRGKGELTVPVAYTNNLELISYLSGTVTGSSAPRIQAEFRAYGSTAGALSHTIQFSDIALKHYEMSEPEGDDYNKFSMAFDMVKEPVRGTGTRIA